MKLKKKLTVRYNSSTVVALKYICCRVWTWKQHPTKQQLNDYLPPIQVKQTRHVGHCWRSRNKLVSNVLLWTPTRRHIGVGQPAKNHINQLYVNTGHSLEELQKAIANRDWWWERERESKESRLSTWLDDDVWEYIIPNNI